MRKSIGALVIGSLAVSGASASEYRYAYTGNDFTNVEAPFTTSDFISFTFYSPTALLPNETDEGFAGPVTRWSLSLGTLHYSSADPGSVIYSMNFSTDAAGNITDYQFTTQTDVVAPGLPPPAYPPTPYEEEVASFNLPSTYGVADLIYIPSIQQDSYYSYNELSAGTWTITSIPEPPAWAMLMLGFAGLGVVSGKRRRMSDLRTIA
jgi:hypothetical protein